MYVDRDAILTLKFLGEVPDVLMEVNMNGRARILFVDPSITVLEVMRRSFEHVRGVAAFIESDPSQVPATIAINDIDIVVCDLATSLDRGVLSAIERDFPHVVRVGFGALSAELMHRFLQRNDLFWMINKPWSRDDVAGMIDAVSAARVLGILPRSSASTQNARSE